MREAIGIKAVEQCCTVERRYEKLGEHITQAVEKADNIAQDALKRNSPLEQLAFHMSKTTMNDIIKRGIGVLYDTGLVYEAGNAATSYRLIINTKDSVLCRYKDGEFSFYRGEWLQDKDFQTMCEYIAKGGREAELLYAAAQGMSPYQLNPKSALDYLAENSRLLELRDYIGPVSRIRAKGIEAADPRRYGARICADENGYHLYQCVQAARCVYTTCSKKDMKDAALFLWDHYTQDDICCIPLSNTARAEGPNFRIYKTENRELTQTEKENLEAVKSFNKNRQGIPRL